MITRKTYLVLCSCMLFAVMGCTIDTDDRHYRIYFYDASDYDVYVVRKLDYSDTSLAHQQNPMHPGWGYKVESHVTNESALYDPSDPYERYFMHRRDTLVVYVFHADSLDLYGWDYAKANYLVQQRYDLSLDDLKRLDWHLYFPPTEAMRDFKMWPPYGTYDAHGNMVE